MTFSKHLGNPFTTAIDLQVDKMGIPNVYEVLLLLRNLVEHSFNTCKMAEVPQCQAAWGHIPLSFLSPDLSI